MRCFIIIIFLFSCTNQKKAAELKMIRNNHESRIKLIRVLPDPMDKRIPDSMKKWIPVMRNVLADDQMYRIVGLGEIKEDWLKQKVLDSVNLKIITSYIDQYGWPENFNMGLFGMKAVGMTIQHAPVGVQTKYYPALLKAVRQDTLLREFLALLEDRINVRNNRCQYYGTQTVFYNGKQVLYPVCYPDSFEMYRAQLKLLPIDNYLQLLKLKWNKTEYLQMLPDLRKGLKVSDTLGLHASL